MGYGTPEYELISKQNTHRVYKHRKGGFKGKHNGHKKFDPRVKTEPEKIKPEKDPMVMYPQLPDNWVKKTETGNASYDESVREISSQLKRTIVR